MEFVMETEFALVFFLVSLQSQIFTKQDRNRQSLCMVHHDALCDYVNSGSYLVTF